MKKRSFFFICFIIILLTACTKQESNSDLAAIEEEKEEIPPKAENYIDTLIENMSIDEKIGQLLIIGFPQEISGEELEDYITSNKFGGVILFKRNSPSLHELYNLNNNLKAWNKPNPLALFICIDEEGGAVSRLPKEAALIPSPSVFGSINDIATTKESGKIIGEQLYAAGINTNFAPVLDILSRKESSLLRYRAYGDKAEVVSKHGLAFIEGQRSQGIISAVKHFPGHGDTREDSHEILPIVSVDYELLKNRELIPFKKAINEGIDIVMVGHISFPEIDDSCKPATKSKIIINDILKKELGFQGLIITDDIEMQGFTYKEQAIEDSVIESFNAGIDMFIIGHTREIQEKVLEALKKSLVDNSIREERLNESLRKIIELKTRYKLTDNMNMSYDEAYQVFTCNENHEFIEKLKSK